jgi:hypothetical protein
VLALALPVHLAFGQVASSQAAPRPVANITGIVLDERSNALNPQCKITAILLDGATVVVYASTKDGTYDIPVPNGQTVSSITYSQPACMSYDDDDLSGSGWQLRGVVYLHHYSSNSILGNQAILAKTLGSLSLTYKASSSQEGKTGVLNTLDSLSFEAHANAAGGKGEQAVAMNVAAKKIDATRFGLTTSF